MTTPQEDPRFARLIEVAEAEGIDPDALDMSELPMTNAEGFQALCRETNARDRVRKEIRKAGAR